MSENFIEELEVDLIRQRNDLNASQKLRSIHEIRSIAKKKNKSYQTISSLANTMVGSTCLVMPLLFRSSGLLSSLLIMSVIAWISYKTCNLIVIHTRENDNDLTFVLNRVLGKVFYYSYCVASSIFLFFVSIIFFILMTNMIYLIVVFFCDLRGSSYHPISEMGWDQFSFQYASLIGLISVFGLLQIKNLVVIVKLGELGILALISYTIFLIVRTIMQIDTGVVSEHLYEIKVFATDFSDICNLCGTFAFTFILHNAIVPIMKHNESAEHNSRDLGLGYALAGGVNLLIGVIGCFGIIGRELCKPGSKGNTVMECFEKGDVSALIIEIIFLFNLITVIPLLSFISRMHFFQIFYETEEAPFIYRMIFNLLIAILCFIMGIFNVDPTLMISITGAICGFFIVYIVPIALHLRCLYKSNSTCHKRLLGEECEELSTNRGESICEHEGKVMNGVPFWARLLFYGTIILIGVALIGIQVYQIVQMVK